MKTTIIIILLSNFLFGIDLEGELQAQSIDSFPLFELLGGIVGFASILMGLYKMTQGYEYNNSSNHYYAHNKFLRGSGWILGGGIIIGLTTNIFATLFILS